MRETTYISCELIGFSCATIDVPWLKYRSTWTVYLFTEIVCPGTRVPLFCCAKGWGMPCS